MAKYYGTIGYVDVIETSPGVYEEQEIEKREYFGEIITFNRRFVPGESVNDNISVSNRISILGDPFAYDNISKMRWIEWLGDKWIISEVEVQHPRLIISLGGVYNG